MRRPCNLVCEQRVHGFGETEIELAGMCCHVDFIETALSFVGWLFDGLFQLVETYFLRNEIPSSSSLERRGFFLLWNIDSYDFTGFLMTCGGVSLLIKDREGK